MGCGIDGTLRLLLAGWHSFDETKKVIDAVTDILEDVSLDNGARHYSPMQFLTRFLFSPPDQQKYIHTLSGGEKRACISPRC